MAFAMNSHIRCDSISKSFVSRRRGEDSAIARRAEGNNDTDDLELECAHLISVGANSYFT